MTKSSMPNIKITQKVNRMRRFIHLHIHLKHAISGIHFLNKNTILSDVVQIGRNKLTKILSNLRTMHDIIKD